MGIGGVEYVYYIESGQVVEGPLEGTYNFIVPDENGFGLGDVGHVVVDFVPWMVWGTGADDHTTVLDRFELLTGQGF